MGLLEVSVLIVMETDKGLKLVQAPQQLLAATSTVRARMTITLLVVPVLNGMPLFVFAKQVK
jgi:hypothetical protein